MVSVFHRSPPAGGAGGEFPRLDFIGRIPPHLDSQPGVEIPRLASASPPGGGGKFPAWEGEFPAWIWGGQISPRLDSPPDSEAQKNTA